MSITIRKTQYLKIALAVSLILIILWIILGAGASLAWFSDETPDVKNVFHSADFELEVSYLDKNGDYQSIEGSTDIFDKNALYEPGYTQTVFFKIENKGNVPFEFKTAISVTDYTLGTNVFGGTFALSDKLRFGLVFDADEQALKNQLAVRDSAQETATMKLGNYSTESAVLNKNSTVYMAITIYMPEKIGNEANYRGSDVPTVELGLIVTATQRKN